MKLTFMPQNAIEEKIYMIRGYKVLLDQDIALLYGVETKQLKRQVRRNRKRFPDDFMFELTKKEYRDFLRCQFGTLRKGGYSKYRPYAFTEQGIAMLSGILNSDRAIQVNIAIMRAFVKLRQILSTNKELAHKLAQLEQRTEKHDTEIHAIFEAIRQLMAPPERPKRKIGFHA